MKNKFLLLLLVGFLWFGGVSPVIAIPGPTEALRPTLDEIMAIITDPTLAGEVHKVERRSKVMTIIKQGFDFEVMSQLVLGKTWRTIDQSQRDHFQELFTKLLENAYIGKLEGYSGQMTEFHGERIKGKKAEVSTVVVHEGLSYPVQYIMLHKDSDWKVYDLKIEGVRLLRNYRAQFSSILRKEKFDGLVKVLEEKNATLSGEDS
ncbi:MAG: ABC transporter substrate-binding protein [Thermodesulfobacteriota bacterium]